MPSLTALVTLPAAAAAVLAAVAVGSASLPALETTAVPAFSSQDTRFLDRPEGKLAYDDIGEGPLVVLVPGLGDLRTEYRFLAPKIADAGYRVVSLDLRGHGQSSVGWSDYTSAALGSDVVALVKELDVGPATLVGTSMGAAAVAWAAAEAPDAVRQLALIGPFVREIPPRSKVRAWMQKAMIRVVLAGPWAASMWGKAYRSFYADVPEDFDAYQQALVANLKEPGRLDALKGMIFASKTDVEARLHEVSAPVLVVMGSADPDFPDPRAEADTVAALLHGSVTMIEGTGHYPHVEKPDAVAEAVLAFAAQERGTD